MTIFQSWRRLRAKPLFSLILFLITACAVFFIVYPLLRVILFPSAGDYGSFFQNIRWLRALRNSMVLTLASMASCTLVAFVFAYTLQRTQVPFKKFFKFITLLPVVSPPFIIALSYILLFGAQGLVTRKLLGLNISIYGGWGLWVVQTVSFFPYAYVVISNVMGNISDNLEYAAMNLGASPRRASQDIFFPLCRPGVAGGALMAAISVLADFGNPSMIGGDLILLPIEAYMQMVGWYDVPSAAVLSTALLIPTLLLFLTSRYWLGKGSYTMLSGKETTLPALSPKPFVSRMVFIFCMVVSLFIALVYGILVVGAFTKTWGYDWSFDPSAFQYVWMKKDQIIRSCLYGAAAALLSSGAGLCLAWLVERSQNRLSSALDFIAVLPSAVPGIFLGLGFAVALGPAPFHLTGTGTIMVLALAVWNIPTCYRTDRAALQQLGLSMEQAAQNLGASEGRAFREIVFPLLKTSFLSGLSLSFLRSMTCLSVVIFIYSAGTSVSTISILSLVNSGQWSGAAAFTVVLVSLAFLILALSSFISRHIGIRSTQHD